MTEMNNPTTPDPAADPWREAANAGVKPLNICYSYTAEGDSFRASALAEAEAKRKAALVVYDAHAPLRARLADVERERDAAREALKGYLDFTTCYRCQAGEMCEECSDAYASLHVDATFALGAPTPAPEGQNP